MSQHIILCGLEHVGYRTLELLLRLDETVTVITNEIPDEWRSDIQSKNIRLIIGNASDLKNLEEADIKNAKAIIITTTNDLDNVSIALDAQRLNPKIGVVVRFFDQSLAQRLEEICGFNRALSTSSLAAPAFAAAALGEHIIGSFEADGQKFSITRVTADEALIAKSKTAEQLAMNEGLITIIHRRENGEQVTTGPETLFLAGDQLAVLERSKKLSKKSSGAKPLPSVFSRLVETIRLFFKSFPSSTGLIFGVLITIILLSVIVFHLALKLDIVSALYFVVTTIATVGYGDINLLNAAYPIKLYGCFLMLCGAAFIGALIGVITNFFVEQRLEELFGSRSVIDTGHTIVVGTGNIGYRIIKELLAAGQKVVVIANDNKDEFLKTVRERVPTILGDARSEDILKKANSPMCKSLVAVTDDDVINLSIGLAAEKLNSKVKTVLRMYNSDLAQKVQSTLGIDAVISTSTVAAPIFVGAALYPNVLTAFTLDEQLIVLLHEKVAQGSPLIGRLFETVEHDKKIKNLLHRSSPTMNFEPTLPQHPIQSGDEFISVHIKQLVK